MVSAISGLCIALFLTGRKREVGLVVGATLMLYLLTFALGGATYRFSILASQKYCPLSLGQLARVMIGGFYLAPALLVVGTAFAGTLLLRKKFLWESGHLFLAITCGFSWFLTFVTSAKRGSNYNYLFEPSVLGFLWILRLYQLSASENRALNLLRLGLPIALLASACLAVRTSAVAFDDWRNKSKAEQNLTERQRRHATPELEPENVQLRRSLADLPAPVLVTERHLNLPWVQTRAPHFVTAYAYAWDRKGGRKYAEGGIGGLIAKGYFETIVTPLPLSTNLDLTVAQVASGPVIDGEPLTRYQLHHSDRRFAYYLKTNESTAPKASLPSSGSSIGLAIDR
jgi:hypothetical protein